jgi:hypothetical protein
MKFPATVFLSLLLLALVACERDVAVEPPRPAMTMMATVVDTSLEFSPLRFEDGAVSLNDRCPVRRARLNRKMPPVFVNGRPVGFC